MRYIKEDNHIIININLIPYKLIYLLLDHNEVVYVGQTHNGLKRPFSHLNKIFDKVVIIECKNDEDIDVLECEYIQKYNPIYNKNINYKGIICIKKVKNELQKAVGLNNITIRHAVKMLNYFEINIIYNNGLKYITKNDFEKVKYYFNYYKEDIKNGCM